MLDMNIKCDDITIAFMQFKIPNAEGRIHPRRVEQD